MKQARHFSVNPGWQLLLRDMGIDPVEVLRLAGLPADLLTRTDAVVSVPQYFTLWEALETLAGSQALPLLIGRSISVETFDAPLFACFCSPNLETALQRLSRYKRLIGPIDLQVESGPRHTRVGFRCYHHDGPLPRSIALTELVFLTQLARLATRHPVQPVEVIARMLPDDPEPYREFFGRAIEAGPENGIVFSATDARRPFLTDNPRMWQFFEKDLQQRLSALDESASTRERVRGVLLEMLPAGESSIEAVASRLAMSKRTLQRHLQDEGESFQRVLQQTREELARHYLVNSRLSQGEISFLLGFQDTNSFIRAYHQWTGVPPGQYRAMR